MSNKRRSPASPQNGAARERLQAAARSPIDAPIKPFIWPALRQGFRLIRLAYGRPNTGCVSFRSRALRHDCFGFGMNNALRIRFPPFKDERSLRLAIESICAEFGKVASLTVLPANRAVGLQCTCLLRLDSAAAESKLRSNFDVIDFGADLLFFAEVDEEWTGRTA